MATATFNTGIAIPLGENTNIYNLDEVITTAGFGETKNFQYRLTTETMGVTVEDNRMAIESSASGGISIRVSNSEEGEKIEAIATTNLYFPYTAIFNTSIETPSSDRRRTRSYDLNTVITKYGFENTEEKFTYELLSTGEGVSLTDNILAVSDSAYGAIEVLVTGGKETQQAIARTKTTGFYATRLELINDESIAATFQNAIDSTKNDWSTLVGANRKAGGGRDDLDSGAEITPGGGIKNP